MNATFPIEDSEYSELFILKTACVAQGRVAYIGVAIWNKTVTLLPN